jgi:hypothetical protein
LRNNKFIEDKCDDISQMIRENEKEMEKEKAQDRRLNQVV